jgi:hypothetical protein
MGNTVLSHVLYSCGQVELDLENFFSDTGNSHKILKLNHTKLTAYHLVEFPTPDLHCILQLRSDDWFHVLQFRMSYFKWCGKVPTLSNLNDFFKQKIQIKDDWAEFYSAARDPSWPDCDSYKEILNLPKYVQEEIQNTYRPPNVLLRNESNLVEFLSETYFDQLLCPYCPTFDAPVYQLSDYFFKRIQALEQVAEQLKWKYNHKRSDNFYSAMLNANQIHCAWLENIKRVHNNVINSTPASVDLQPWERALTIAKICITLGCHPNSLNWQDSHCFLDNNNITLIKSLQGKYHGKTI